MLRIGMATERSAATRLKDSFSLSRVDQMRTLALIPSTLIDTRCRTKDSGAVSSCADWAIGP